MKFEGIYTPVLTPYDVNHAINFDAIGLLLRISLTVGFMA